MLRDTKQFILHSHDASTPVIRIASSGFIVVAMPSNDGIISVVTPSEIPLVKRMEFFINVAST